MKIAVIPARYNSSRFPGKPLVPIFGKPMLQHVYENAKRASLLDDVLIATDDERIQKFCTSIRAKVAFTHQKHLNGTSRCLEAITAHFPNIEENDIVLNIQGDNPFISAKQIEQIIRCFNNSKTEIATLKKLIVNSKEIQSNHVVKIESKGGYAINFFRKNQDSTMKQHYKHIGLYGFRFSTLKKILMFPETSNEKKSQLEQLRWLENNIPINVLETKQDVISVDTPEDLKKIIDKAE